MASPMGRQPCATTVSTVMLPWESQPDRSRVVDLPVQEQRVVAGPLCAAGETADLGCLGESEVQSHNQVLHREGKGVGQQHEMRLLGPGNAHQVLPLVRSCVQVWQLLPVQVKRLDVHAGQSGRGDRQGRTLLHFEARADDATAGAAESVVCAQHIAQCRAYAPVIGLIVR